MKANVKAAQIVANPETGKRVVKLTLDAQVVDSIERDTWEKIKSNRLSVKFTQFGHFINDDESDLGLDLQFMLMTASNAQIETALNGATIEFEQELIEAGTAVEVEGGDDIIADHDYFRLTSFNITAVSPFGRYAVDYDGVEDFNPRSKEAKAAYKAAHKA